MRRRGLDRLVHAPQVRVVEPAGCGFDQRPAHEEPDDVEAVTLHVGPVRLGDGDDRGQFRIVLVVIAERVQVDAPQQHAPPAGIENRGLRTSRRVQRRQLRCDIRVAGTRRRARRRRGRRPRSPVALTAAAARSQRRRGRDDHKHPQHPCSHLHHDVASPLEAVTLARRTATHKGNHDRALVRLGCRVVAADRSDDRRQPRAERTRFPNNEAVVVPFQNVRLTYRECNEEVGRVAGAHRARARARRPGSPAV